MERSPEIDKLAAALHKAQADGLVAVKTSENEHLKSRYADLVAVYEVVRPVMAEHGLSLSQFPGLVRELNTGKHALGLTNVLMHSSGQWMSAPMEMPLPPEMKGLNAAQVFGLVLTYARRYGVCSVMGVATGDDDDAQRAFRQGTRNEEPARVETWQDYYTSGAWRECDSPDWGTLGEVKKAAEMFAHLKGNSANGFSNLPLVAASAWTVEHLCKGRGLTLAEGLAKANLAPDILTLKPEDLYAAVQVISAIPKPAKEGDDA